MPSRLIYLPIEPYASRSTEYMSVPDGVYETCFKEAGVQFKALRPDTTVRQIGTGAVVDVLDRTAWSNQQVQWLVQGFQEGCLDPKEDVIYFEDFWTPGFEMVPYTQCLVHGYDKRGHVPCFAFCHAQTVDPFDFTHKMAYWMRPMEHGWANYLTGITIACKEMLGQMHQAGWPIADPYSRTGSKCKAHVCGLGFNEKVFKRVGKIPDVLPSSKDRQPVVVFSSRWDSEKNPHFFLQLASKFSVRRPEVQFKVVTGLEKLTSNNKTLLAMLQDYVHMHSNLELIEGLSKTAYFEILRQASVQFNCASQDYISYSLLDATVNGCQPLYPNYLTFPDALEHNYRHLYDKGSLESAEAKLNDLLDNPAEDVSWVHSKYEGSVARMLKAMGFEVNTPELAVANWR